MEPIQSFMMGFLGLPGHWELIMMFSIVVIIAVIVVLIGKGKRSSQHKPPGQDTH